MLNKTSHAGKETENKGVFKREQKTGGVVADATSVGRLFHKRLSTLALRSSHLDVEH